MNVNNNGSLSTNQDNENALMRSTRSSSSIRRRRQYGQQRPQVVNEWESNSDHEKDVEYQLITPCVEAKLASAPKREFANIQGKSSTVGQLIENIDTKDILREEKYCSVSQSVCQTDVQLRPKRSCSGGETNGSAQVRISRTCSGIYQSNGIESHPISHAERRVQFRRRRSTGSFREALEIGYVENESLIGNKEADSGIHAHSVETEQLTCPRDSIDMCLRRQDSSFNFFPDPDHYPIRRNSTGCTMVYPEWSTEEEDESIIMRLFSQIFNKRDSTDFSLVCKEQILVQHPAKTGRKPFGCWLHSCRSGDGKWFHFVKLDYTPNSMARQLKIRDHDEVLMINDTPVISLDHEQVLMKFLYVLKERNIRLLFRRMVSMAGGGFEYIEIKARIEVDETIIVRCERVDYSGYMNIYKMSTKDKRLCLIGNKYIGVRNSALALTSPADNSVVFEQTIYRVLVNFTHFKYFCTLYHKPSNKYITGDGNTVQLTSQANRSPSNRKLTSDRRLFFIHEDSDYTYLEHVSRSSCYLAYKDSAFCLLSSSRPANYRDYCYFKITDP